MTIDFELQDVSGAKTVPDVEQFRSWLATVLAERGDVSLAVRVVDAEEMEALNTRYRGRKEPTNVLSFPADLPEAVRGALESDPLGDIVICAPVVEAEALSQDKPATSHWAHLTIHGALHLLGYDHQAEAAAKEMEALEVRCLSALGIPDPYRE
ncbi:MAG TPA: rRNA maturation RNase YbeY [Burkholderiales bacterium]|nr:rRNA maturation RNase YbeY [Burkholderiales bacterium]